MMIFCNLKMASLNTKYGHFLYLIKIFNIRVKSMYLLIKIMFIILIWLLFNKII